MCFHSTASTSTTGLRLSLLTSGFTRRKATGNTVSPTQPLSRSPRSCDCATGLPSSERRKSACSPVLFLPEDAVLAWPSRGLSRPLLPPSRALHQSTLIRTVPDQPRPSQGRVSSGLNTHTSVSVVRQFFSPSHPRPLFPAHGGLLLTPRIFVSTGCNRERDGVSPGLHTRAYYSSLCEGLFTRPLGRELRSGIEGLSPVSLTSSLETAMGCYEKLLIVSLA